MKNCISDFAGWHSDLIALGKLTPAVLCRLAWLEFKDIYTYMYIYKVKAQKHIFFLPILSNLGRVPSLLRYFAVFQQLKNPTLSIRNAFAVLPFYITNSWPWPNHSPLKFWAPQSRTAIGQIPSCDVTFRRILAMTSRTLPFYVGKTILEQITKWCFIYSWISSVAPSPRANSTYQLSVRALLTAFRAEYRF